MTLQTFKLRCYINHPVIKVENPFPMHTLIVLVFNYSGANERKVLI